MELVDYFHCLVSTHVNMSSDKSTEVTEIKEKLECVNFEECYETAQLNQWCKLLQTLWQYAFLDIFISYLKPLNPSTDIQNLTSNTVKTLGMFQCTPKHVLSPFRPLYIGMYCTHFGVRLVLRGWLAIHALHTGYRGVSSLNWAKSTLRSNNFIT